MLYAPLRLLALWFCRLYCGVVVRRRPEHLPEGGFILASNHQSYLDPILLGITLRRPLSFMARESLFKNPLFGRLIRSTRAFPVRRDGVGKQGLRDAADRLKAGEAVVVFAEGTRSRDGRLGPVKDGAGLLSRIADVPVLPAAVDTFHAWPREKALPRPRRIAVAYGEPIPAERFRRDPEGARHELETSLQQLMSRLSETPSTL